MRTLGRYNLITRIATGGMAEIYVAREVGLAGFERLAVVKRILPALAQDDEFITLFLDEARIAARLTHPRIVHIYELGRDEESFFIAMEYVPGCDLETLLAVDTTPIPLGIAVYIACEALEGLHYAHSLRDVEGVPLSVVHRDMAPKNVLISVDGAVKIADFGIAKARTKVSVTAPGLVLGTYTYMSPEQASGQVVDLRADLFATGALLYRMVTGLNAYRTEGMDLVEQVRKGDVHPPRLLNPDLPEAIEDVIMQAMRPDPRDRYGSAAEMRRALARAGRRLGLEGDAEELAGLVRSRLPDLQALLQSWFDASAADGAARPTPALGLPPEADTEALTRTYARSPRPGPQQVSDAGEGMPPEAEVEETTDREDAPAVAVDVSAAATGAAGGAPAPEACLEDDVGLDEPPTILDERPAGRLHVPADADGCASRREPSRVGLHEAPTEVELERAKEGREPVRPPLGSDAEDEAVTLVAPSLRGGDDEG